MSRGKYYSLGEALQKNDVKGFAKAHPSTGDKELFDDLFSAMTDIKKPAKADRTSKKG